MSEHVSVKAKATEDGWMDFLVHFRRFVVTRQKGRGLFFLQGPFHKEKLL